MIAPHMLERVEEKYEDQIARRQQQWRNGDYGKSRPSMPEPMDLGMADLTLEEDEAPCRQSSPSLPQPVNDQLFERLTMLYNQLESVVELSRPNTPQRRIQYQRTSPKSLRSRALSGFPNPNR